MDARLAAIRERLSRADGSIADTLLMAYAKDDVGYLLARIDVLERALSGLVKILDYPVTGTFADCASPLYWKQELDAAKAALQPSEEAQ